jgi:hypothetical protein
VSVCIGVHLFAGQSNIMPRRRANVGRRTRRAERATATRGRVQLVLYNFHILKVFIYNVLCSIFDINIANNQCCGSHK